MIEITDQQKDLIEKSTLSFCTVDAAGAPNVIAVACVKVVSRNQVLITDNYFEKTRANLMSNTSVAFAVWGEHETPAFQFKGTAEYFHSGSWKERVDQLFENEGLPHKGAVLVTVGEIWDLTGADGPFRE